MKEWMSFRQHTIHIFSGLFLVIFISFVIWRRFKRKREVIVNCWFCNVNSSVPAGNANCWDCLHCNQYNGFDREGNYNKPIPSQYYAEFNQGVFARNSKATSDDPRFNNILCDQCNQNQQLKVQQLAMFVPDDEKTFDYEIEEYSAHLDSLYQLCLGCELQTQRKLKNVDDWVQRSLLGKRLMQFKNFTSKKQIPRRLPFVLRWCVLLCLVILIILDVAAFRTQLYLKTIVDKNHASLSINVCTVVISILAVLSRKPVRLTIIDLICILYWMLMILPHHDTIVDRGFRAFPWRSELETYVISKDLPTDVQQKFFVTISFDVIGCVLGMVFVRKLYMERDNKKLRKLLNQPVFTDISRQSSFSSIPSCEVDGLVQKKVSEVTVMTDDPLNCSLGSLSLAGDDPAKPGSETVSLTGKERRPLISPAKFTIGDSVRKRKIPDMDTPISVSLASSHTSSVRGSVHSNMTERFYQTKTKDLSGEKNQQAASSPVMYMLLGFSLGINITIIVVVIFWNTLHKTS
ncbi:uncharacterized protein [Antedon mediterranea]|uniref:uncharacterized protein isoform X2 n=1 Tax=Antedon mediterranea TaxID=105859 RepID=UPI003AF7AC75